MRHAIAHRKLGRTPGHRKALLRNMMNALVRSERIETTVAKAKEVRRLADRLITLGKQDTTHARRRTFSLLSDKGNTEKIFAALAARFSGREGGYTRIVRTGYRAGDGSEMAILEYLPEEEKKPKGDKGEDQGEWEWEEPAGSGLSRPLFFGLSGGKNPLDESGTYFYHDNELQIHFGVVSPSLETLLQRIDSEIAAIGGKRSKSRSRVIEVFFRSGTHVTLEELTHAVRKRSRSVGSATVYRTVKLLERLGYAKELDFGGGIKRYENNLVAHHDHLVCQECGADPTER